ncbi:hypothetical protein T4E_10596 [Trichinella pseudospiralis]|uniref:Uncharacterized protein n=1 Tax=Trichinella pseudospiralis TaxID=6337 RepID=A0A0V0Y3R5_TRIPS|nr:hypothetical protein T4E_10596 [Trichinella pseudospiralis]
MFESNIVIRKASRTELPTVILFSHKACTRSGLSYIFGGSDCSIRLEVKSQLKVGTAGPEL